MRRKLLLATLLAGLTIGAPRTGHAEPPAIDVKGDSLDATAVRRAIAAEFKRVRAEATGPLEIELEADGKAAVLRYRPANRPAITRRLQLPPDPARAVEAIALLATNLVKDEAAELLKELTEADSATKDPPAPDSPPPPETPAEPDTTEPPRAKRTEATSRPARDGRGGSRERNRVDPEPDASVPRRDLLGAPVNVSLVHPLAVYVDSEDRAVNLELGALFSRVGAIHGVGVNAALLWSEGALHGFVLGGFGLHYAAPSDGFQLAGFGTWGTADVRGAQIAGGTHFVKGNINGVQLAPVNITTGTATGAQIGVFNYAGSGATGAQVSLFNIAGHASGVQVGLVNVADSNSGVPIGLLTFGGDTDLKLGLFATTRIPINVGLKFVTGKFFHQLVYGVVPSRSVGRTQVDRAVQSAQYRLGVRLVLEPLFVEPSLGYGFEAPYDSDSADQAQHVASYRGVVGWQISDGFAPIVGLGARTVINADPDTVGDPAQEFEAMVGVEFF